LHPSLFALFSLKKYDTLAKLPTGVAGAGGEQAAGFFDDAGHYYWRGFGDYAGVGGARGGVVCSGGISGLG
jgi:hypothetical protein